MPQEPATVVTSRDQTTLNNARTTRMSCNILTILKVVASVALLVSSVSNYSSHFHYWVRDGPRRRLMNAVGPEVPSYMKVLLDDLASRKRLFEETPPEEVKYWFEYTGPLQKYYYRYSKSRGKADAFEGRDDSGVFSARFVEPGGGEAHRSFLHSDETKVPANELAAHYRLLDNCFALGSKNRPDLTKDSDWFQWFGSSSSKDQVLDRCRVLITMNTVGAGKGSTILWETHPPVIHGNGPKPWMSEQETAAMHLERNLKEIDAMCATGLMAVRLQILVCEPIPGIWTDWMDSMLTNCGGMSAPLTEHSKNGSPYDGGVDVTDRPSPIQVVVVASANTADTCHDLKSGFMEKRMQDLILAPPYLEKAGDVLLNNFDSSIKTTHRDLVSSDDHDLYVGMKWSSLVSTRSIFSFLQASADLAVAAASPHNIASSNSEKETDGSEVVLNGPHSPFLIPSFIRVSYVSEENNKVAKWRMHGDFFHPAAWEICKDSFDVTWIPDSLSGNRGISGICYEKKSPAYSSVQQKMNQSEEESCGQWWIYMAEEQMPTSPEIYANEETSTLVQGGSNSFWMLTERHRQEIVTQKVCEYNAQGSKEQIAKCGEIPQAVLPLGDLESFMINFQPNTALGKKHSTGRRPGYSKAKEREEDRDLVRKRKQLKGQEDIEKALFDYTIYPVALLRKDATLKAARLRDLALTETLRDSIGPVTVKSSYYDVTITKPREATLGWCQSISRNGLCTLYGDYFRQSLDTRCMEACGMKKNWSRLS